VVFFSLAAQSISTPCVNGKALGISQGSNELRADQTSPAHREVRLLKDLENAAGGPFLRDFMIQKSTRKKSSKKKTHIFKASFGRCWNHFRTVASKKIAWLLLKWILFFVAQMAKSPEPPKCECEISMLSVPSGNIDS